MAKMSENSIKVINYLKENHGKKMTSTDVAEALDLTTAQVNGVFTALSNKELGYREEATVTGTADISFLAITDEGAAADVSEISENGQKIMAYLKDVAGQNVTAADAAEALDIDKRKFTGAFNALVKKGFAVRNSAKVEAPVTVKYLVLTDAGMAFDPTEIAE
jgi:DNA-binding MarR family transcriptional regulator